jgi:hypothetical protein
VLEQACRSLVPATEGEALLELGTHHLLGVITTSHLDGVREDIVRDLVDHELADLDFPLTLLSVRVQPVDAVLEASAAVIRSFGAR